MNEDNYYNKEIIENGNVNKIVSTDLEKILHRARRILIINKITTFLILFSIIVAIFYKPEYILLTFLFIIIKIYLKTFGRLKIKYDIALDQKEVINQKMEPWIKLNECEKVWRVIESKSVKNNKYTAGADSSVKRIKCTTSKKAPYPFKINIPVATFKSKKEIIFFTPDKLFVMQDLQIGALNYSEINFNVFSVNFRETEKIPKNAEIIGYTWEYLNKSGEPDKRFKDNKQIPICSYGEIVLKSTTGLNVAYLFSK